MTETRAERVGTAAVAAITGFSRRKVQALAERGKIPTGARIAGGAWSFDECAVRRWIKEEEARGCQITSTDAAMSYGAASKSRAGSIVEAYERAIGLRRVSVSTHGSRKLNTSAGTESRAIHGSKP